MWTGASMRQSGTERSQRRTSSSGTRIRGDTTERTEVRIVFDRESLYMGVSAFDSEPDRLFGNTMKRDEFLRADDRFMWTMDTFMDQQTGYFFEMNPSGLMADALILAGGGNQRAWDGIWDAYALRHEEAGR